MDQRICETEEIVSNPSVITQHMLGIVSRLNEKHEKKFHTKNFFSIFVYGVKLRLYLKEGFGDFYGFLQNYTPPPYLETMTGTRKIKALFGEFEKVYDKLIFNNIALGFAHIQGEELENSVMTLEDEKIACFKKLASGAISDEDFKDKFGHYALNAYELSSKRFEEYTSSELRELASLSSNIEIKEKPLLEDYISEKTDKKTPVLLALRELAKYKVLFIVRDIRYELLKLAELHNVGDIFGMTFEEILACEKEN